MNANKNKTKKRGLGPDLPHRLGICGTPVCQTAENPFFVFIRVHSRLTGFGNLQPRCENGYRTETDIMTQNQTLFFHKFGITPNDLERYLAEALSAGGDF